MFSGSTFFVKIARIFLFPREKLLLFKVFIALFFFLTKPMADIQVVCMSLGNYVLGMGGGVDRANQSKTTTSESIQVLCLNIHH